MKIEQFTPSQVVYDVHSHRMGNTTMKTTGCWTVRIVSIDLEKSIVHASWNTNPQRPFFKSQWSKWRKEKPLMIGTCVGGKRLATRDEIKAARAPVAGENEGQQ